MPLAPALHLPRDRGEALRPAEMRLEPALRHLLLVLRRHAGDDRHHALGREIVDELRLRLIETGRVLSVVSRFLRALAGAFYGLKLDEPEPLLLDEVPRMKSDNDARRFLPPARELDVGPKESILNWQFDIRQNDRPRAEHRLIVSADIAFVQESSTFRVDPEHKRWFERIVGWLLIHLPKYEPLELMSLTPILEDSGDDLSILV